MPGVPLEASPCGLAIFLFSIVFLFFLSFFSPFLFFFEAMRSWTARLEVQQAEKCRHLTPCETRTGWCYVFPMREAWSLS